MEGSAVYFTDFRCPVGTSLTQKLRRLCLAAGIKNIDMTGRFVAIKMHFGELGNLAFLRPNYAKVVADLCKEQGGMPFLTDCNTLYPGSRKNALEHLTCAQTNGFWPMTTGCQILIGDGLRGTDEVEVPVPNGEFCKTAKIGRAIMDADVFISLTHFKGHESTGFGGAIKNIGMGCGSRAGKMEQHSSGAPAVQRDLCRGCHRCAKECGSDAIHYDAENKAVIDYDLCKGCGRCIGACSFDAIYSLDNSANEELDRKMAEYAAPSAPAVPASTSAWCRTSAPTATATARTTPPSCPTSACSHPLTRWPWTRPAPTPAWRQPPLPTASWARTWPNPAGTAITTTSRIPTPTSSGRQPWSRPRRSAWASAPMS